MYDLRGKAGISAAGDQNFRLVVCPRGPRFAFDTDSPENSLPGRPVAVQEAKRPDFDATATTGSNVQPAGGERSVCRLGSGLLHSDVSATGLSFRTRNGRFRGRGLRRKKTLQG